jgi:hypothetical protein
MMPPMTWMITKNPRPEPGQVAAAHIALLAELHVAGGQPGEQVD